MEGEPRRDMLPLPRDGVARTSALPLETRPVVHNIPLSSQDYCLKQLEPDVQSIRSDMRILAQIGPCFAPISLNSSLFMASGNMCPTRLPQCHHTVRLRQMMERRVHRIEATLCNLLPLSKTIGTDCGIDAVWLSI